MIKYLLGAILALAIIGGAFEIRSTDQNWQLIVHKKEALNSVTNGAIRIYKIVTELLFDSDLMNDESLKAQ
jgi:hypothetical protein